MVLPSLPSPRYCQIGTVGVSLRGCPVRTVHCSERKLYRLVVAVFLFPAGDAECVVRCSPGEDATNGFFVSCFVRHSVGDPTKLGKRSRPPVEDGHGGSVIRTGKNAGKEKPERSKKNKKSKISTATCVGP